MEVIAGAGQALSGPNPAIQVSTRQKLCDLELTGHPNGWSGRAGVRGKIDGSRIEFLPWKPPSKPVGAYTTP